MRARMLTGAVLGVALAVVPVTGASAAAPYQPYGAIGSAYTALGGPESFLGAPTDGERNWGTARAQDFEHGAIVWTERTGAHVLRGAILEKYRALGGPGSFLGVPTTNEVTVRSAQQVTFTGGVVVWTPTTGAHEVHGAILARYSAMLGAAGYLGVPTTDEHDVPGGRQSRFERGTITWDRTANTVQATGLVPGFPD